MSEYIKRISRTMLHVGGYRFAVAVKKGKFRVMTWDESTKSRQEMFAEFATFAEAIACVDEIEADAVEQVC